MASKLNKSEYERALSAEYGFPVFLTDKEFERLSATKTPVRPAQPYQDPFAYVDEAKAKKSSPDAWGTKPGTSYNKDNGRAGAKLTAAHTAKRAPTVAAAPLADVPAPSPIGKIAPASTPTDTQYEKLTYQAPPTFPSPPAGMPKQSEFGAADFGVPMTGDPINAKAPTAAQPPAIAALPDLGPMPQWQSDEEEVNSMFARYAMLGK